jgi:hypothetical protein
MFRKRFSYTLKTIAAPEVIWQIWTDVDRWADWDTELKDACLKGDFALNAVGKLTPRKGRVSEFRVSQLNLGQSYTFTIALPLCKLNIHRYLSCESDGIYFTHEVTFSGILAFLFGLLLGRDFRAALPRVMENVKQIAENA